MQLSKAERAKNYGYNMSGIKGGTYLTALNQRIHIGHSRKVPFLDLKFEKISKRSVYGKPTHMRLR